MSIAQWAEAAIFGGYGDDVLVGIFKELLDGVDPEKLYEYIRNNKPLLGLLGDTDISAYKKPLRYIDVDKILTVDYVVSLMQKDHSHLLSVILNTRDGLLWLDRQIAEIRQKLLT